MNFNVKKEIPPNVDNTVYFENYYVGLFEHINHIIV